MGSSPTLKGMDFDQQRNETHHLIQQVVQYATQYESSSQSSGTSTTSVYTVSQTHTHTHTIPFTQAFEFLLHLFFYTLTIHFPFSSFFDIFFKMSNTFFFHSAKSDGDK
jgi:hypothetical protein